MERDGKDRALQGEERRLIVLSGRRSRSLLAGEAGAGGVLVDIRAFTTLFQPVFLPLYSEEDLGGGISSTSM